MSPFTPVYRDGRSAASLIAELADGKPYGYILTYEEIAEQLGIDATDLVRIRSAMARTKDRLLRDYKRGVRARANEGYQILKPGEHEGLAKKHRKKSDGQIKKAIKVIKGADERDMSDSERERNRQLGMVLEQLHDRQTDTEQRLSRLEALVLGGSSAPRVIPGTVVLAEIEAAVRPVEVADASAT